MKNALYLFFALIVLSALNITLAQSKGLQLKNVLVIGQLDKPEDRYSMEINVTEILTELGVKAIPSLNMLKLGTDASLIATDSMKQLISAKGIDTYLLVSVRGYDKIFKATTLNDDFNTALGAGNLFPLYRDEIVSVSFEFKFFRNGAMVQYDIIKCGNVSNRDAVIKKLRKQLRKIAAKNWK
ncbi:MAG: hypothetical protein ACK49D_02060 [Flavobacteriia bacterium]|jgi:hypothetical protein|nr:hypothetical protein [Cryomorphaceae bacterium]